MSKIYYECPVCHCELRMTGDTRWQGRMIEDQYFVCKCPNMSCVNYQKVFFPENRPKKLDIYEGREFMPIITPQKPMTYDEFLQKKLRYEGFWKGKWITKRNAKIPQVCEYCGGEIKPGEKVFTYSYTYYYKIVLYLHEACYEKEKEKNKAI